MLKKAGFESDMAYDAAQALEWLALRHYDVLTLDLMLPDRDGISLIRELRMRESTADLPIIVVSARAEQGRLQLNGDAMWVADWLQKPIDQDALTHAVAHAAERLQQRKPHILHVEDEPDIVGIVQVIFQDTAVITAANTLEQARELLEKEAFDLMILDLNLPDGSGTELLPLLRNQNAHIPVVIFSVREDGEHLLRQVNATLVKSHTTNEQLLRTITQLIPVTDYSALS